MTTSSDQNPLLAPIRESFSVKRIKKSALVPRNWLLILLKILDELRTRTLPINEDDIYTYDFTLKKSRAAAIPKLLKKYGMPTNLGLSREGVTVRGAPAYRVFRAIRGGGIIAEKPPAERDALILEAIELIRQEILAIVGQKPVTLPSNVFGHTGKFIPALLEAVTNRSNGRVEQAIVGAKLQLRFPDEEVAANVGYAGDRQTGREADYEVGQLRVIVSVTPGAGHFESARLLADEDREVYLVVSEKASQSAKNRIRKMGYEGPVIVMSVSEYVTSNMKEIGQQLHLSSREMCLRLVSEYNRRVGVERDHSLQVVLPSDD